jgi:hypothetical protein
LRTLGVEGFESLKRKSHSFGSRMHVTLADGDTAMASNSHDCKRLSASFTQTGKHCVAQRMQDGLWGEAMDPFAIDLGTSHISMEMVE